MARQILNNGSAANDGTGDTLRDAADKINSNFRDLYTQFGDSSGLTDLVRFDSNSVLFSNTITSGEITLSPTPGGTAQIFLPDSDGTVIVDTATQSFSNKTISDSLITTTELQSPAITNAIFGDSSNGSEILKFVHTTNAVNEISIANATTGQEPQISVTGTDTHIDMQIGAKGDGVLEINSSFSFNHDSVSESTSLTGNNLPMTQSLTIFDYAVLDPTINVPDGSHQGQLLTLVNKSTATDYVQLDIGTYAHNGGSTKSLQLRSTGICQMLWSSLGWHLLGDSNSSHFL